MTGILGGTFDPPHNGHVALAKGALEQLPIDELAVLVSEHPGHRGVVADPQTRLRLAQAAFPGLTCSSIRTRSRSTRCGPEGSARTRSSSSGADQAAEFRPVAGARGGAEVGQARRRHARRLSVAGPLALYGDRVVVFELASPDVSSSEVRKRIAAGETIDDLVPPAVARLIEELGLYR